MFGLPGLGRLAVDSITNQRLHPRAGRRRSSSPSSYVLVNFVVDLALLPRSIRGSGGMTRGHRSGRRSPSKSARGRSPGPAAPERRRPPSRARPRLLGGDRLARVARRSSPCSPTCCRSRTRWRSTRATPAPARASITGSGTDHARSRPARRASRTGPAISLLVGFGIVGRGRRRRQRCSGCSPATVRGSDRARGHGRDGHHARVPGADLRHRPDDVPRGGDQQRDHGHLGPRRAGVRPRRPGPDADVHASATFVVAARGTGATDRRILFPRSRPTSRRRSCAYALVLAAVAIVVEASLSFLGLGVPRPTCRRGAA